MTNWLDKWPIGTEFAYTYNGDVKKRTVVAHTISKRRVNEPCLILRSLSGNEHEWYERDFHYHVVVKLTPEQDTKCCDGYPYCYCDEMASERGDDTPAVGKLTTIDGYLAHINKYHGRPTIADCTGCPGNCRGCAEKIDKANSTEGKADVELKQKDIINPIHYNDVPETKEEIDRMWDITRNLCK